MGTSSCSFRRRAPNATPRSQLFLILTCINPFVPRLIVSEPGITIGEKIFEPPELVMKQEAALAGAFLPPGQQLHVTRVEVRRLAPCNACGRPAPYVVAYNHHPWAWRLCWKHVPPEAPQILNSKESAGLDTIGLDSIRKRIEGHKRTRRIWSLRILENPEDSRAQAKIDYQTRCIAYWKARLKMLGKADVPLVPWKERRKALAPS